VRAAVVAAAGFSVVVILGAVGLFGERTLRGWWRVRAEARQRDQSLWI
jgi:hypothetical protein